MLPLWRSEMRIVLCPDKVILLGVSKGLRRKMTYQTILPCFPMPGAPAWQPALNAIEHWLDVTDWRRSSAMVILSNHFVRYALMPFSDEVANAVEELTLAQIMMEDTYGEIAKQWRLRITGGEYGEPRLIAAMDTALLDAITEITTRTDIRLTSIKPYFMSAFNGFREQMLENDGMFALVESGRIVLAIFKNKQLSGVRHMQLNDALNEQLPDLLLREISLNGLEPNELPVYLHVAEKPDFNLPSDSGLSIQVLRHMGKDEHWWNGDARFNMARAG